VIVLGAALGCWAAGAAAQSDTGADPIIGATDVLASPEALTLVHPDVVTTARLQADGTSVNIFGIDGERGDAAQGLQAYLAAAGDRVDCRSEGSSGDICVTPDGTDIAEVALANGAARARPEAPDAYRQQEIAAQDARRGLWANLPPPPETVPHPLVRDTATLASATKTYPLDGVIGLDAPYAGQLLDYIAAHGDSVTCVPQGEAGEYVCLLPDGTDIATVALFNGAAQAAPDAPDSYRAQQLDALNNRRGSWLAAPDEVITAALTPPLQTEYVFAAGDDGADGVTYAGKTPMAVIGGTPVFLAFAAGSGWGYYDHYRRWHAAPGPYRAHFERFHPDGRGLPGVGYRGEATQALRSGNVIDHGSAWLSPTARPGMPFSAERPGVYGHSPEPASSRHPGMVEPWRQPEVIRPADHSYPGGMARAAAGFAPPAGGGFSNQRAASQGGFRSGAPAQAMRPAAPPPHAANAAVRRQ
jgi:endonuclease YncB( thermonuclease family)